MKAIASLLTWLCWTWMLGISGLGAQPSDQRRQLAEFGHLSQQIMKTSDPDQQIVLVERAQKLFASIRNWPASMPGREVIDADMRALLGQAYLSRRSGDPIDNLEKAIQYLEASVASGARRAGQPGPPGASASWGLPQPTCAGCGACAQKTWRQPFAPRRPPCPF
jgi:hypothetical protein